ncbi:MAG: hypothetical protein ACRD4L_13540, partial [Pyrinomonadaceae bacterium]
MKSLKLPIAFSLILAILLTLQSVHHVHAGVTQKNGRDNSGILLKNLARISDVVDEAIKKGQTPGAVVLV